MLHVYDKSFAGVERYLIKNNRADVVESAWLHEHTLDKEVCIVYNVVSIEDDGARIREAVFQAKDNPYNVAELMQSDFPAQEATQACLRLLHRAFVPIVRDHKPGLVLEYVLASLKRALH